MIAAQLVGSLDGARLYTVLGGVLEPRDGEPMLAAINRTAAELRAACRRPEIVLTDRQWRDLQIELNEAHQVFGLIPSDKQCRCQSIGGRAVTCTCAGATATPLARDLSAAASVANHAESQAERIGRPRADTTGMDETTDEKILALLEADKPTSCKTIADALGVTTAAARKVLAKLVAVGKAKAEGKTRARVYWLVTSGPSKG